MQNKFTLIIIVELMVTIAVVGGIIWWWNTQTNEELAGTSTTAAVETADQFTDRVQAAFQSGNLDKIKELIFWKGVDDFIRETVEESILDDLQHQFLEVQLLPPDSDEPMEFTVNGTRYIPNLPVEGRIQVFYQTTHSDGPTWTSYFYGKHQGKSFIALSVPSN